MGFFSRKKDEIMDEPLQYAGRHEELPYTIKTNEEGKLEIDYYDENTDKFYDTTRLIIDQNPTQLAEKIVYNCKVSWYGQQDAELYNDAGRDTGRKYQFQDILMEINMNLLNDSNYVKMIATSLLDKNRVEKYILNGLNENPERPCGKYIGGVRLNQDGLYTKYFDADAGRASHYSQTMVERRNNERNNLIASKEKEVEKKRMELAELEEELRKLKEQGNNFIDR